MSIRPRRRPAPPPSAPARLLTFSLKDWPGSLPDAFAAWRDGRAAFAASDDSDALGDAVDRIAEERRIRRFLFLNLES